jgi:hypothetical protein
VVQGSTFDEFVEQLKTVRTSLPVIESEIGDTWIYGGKAFFVNATTAKHLVF